MICRHGSFTWDGIPIHPYKEDGGTHFKAITRQTLRKAQDDLPVELRYFEIAEGGHSTLERHLHSHLVMVIRGRGQVLVGEEVAGIEVNDVVSIDPMTWHQFQASRGDVLGFLCIVNCERDRPQRPTDEDLAELRQNPTVGEFIRV